MSNHGWITAGLFIRREIRRVLLAHGVQFREEKGWLDSQFIFDSPLPHGVDQWFREVAAKDRAQIAIRESSK